MAPNQNDLDVAADIGSIKTMLAAMVKDMAAMKLTMSSLARWQDRARFLGAICMLFLTPFIYCGIREALQ